MSEVPPPNTLPTSPRFTSRRRRRRWQLWTRGLSLLALLLVTHLTLRNLAQGAHSIPFAYAYTPSPNYDDRPDESKIDCVVLHATVEPTLAGTIAIFQDPKRRVSAHYVVEKDGRVVQMVPVEKRAWHAGISELEGTAGVNDFSVGIEMVNRNDGRDPYPDAQKEAVAGIVRLLRSRFDIPDSRIVSHSQVALPAGRKSDPQGFDFAPFRALCQAPPAETRLSPAPPPPISPPE